MRTKTRIHAAAIALIAALTISLATTPATAETVPEQAFTYSDGTYAVNKGGDKVLWLPGYFWINNQAFGPGRWTLYDFGWGTSRTLTFQADGNLVRYVDGRATWASHTAGRGVTFNPQADGNVVIYDKYGRAIWHSNTAGTSVTSRAIWTGRHCWGVQVWTWYLTFPIWHSTCN